MSGQGADISDTTEPARPRRRERPRRGPWGLLGMLAMIVLAEGVAESLERTSFTTNSASSWRQTGRAAQREARRAEVLCFGDSMIKFGVAPRVIEARTGLRAYNLAPYGGPPTASEILLRRALDAGARPRAIMVNFMPHLLAATLAQQIRLWPEMIDPSEALALAWHSRDAAFFADVLLARFLTTYRDRHEVRLNLHHALNGESYNAVIAHWVTPLRRNWRVNRGAELAARNPDFDGSANPADTALFPTDWRPDRANAGSMRRFLDLAASREIPVFWILTPLSPATQALREEQGHDAVYTRLVRSVQRRYTNVTVIDARHAGFTHDLFIDPVHLDREGAVALSLELATVLRDHLSLVPGGSGGRSDRDEWVSLTPIPSLRPAIAGLEDLDQSRLVLREIEDHVRR